MKKLLTFCAAVLVVVSLWGTEVTIGEITSSKSEYMPFVATNQGYNSITQLLYLSSDFTTQSVTSGEITKISFYYIPNSGDVAKQRTIEVWLDTVSKSNLATSEGNNKWFYYNSSNAAGVKCFDGTIDLPTAAGWYTITLANSFLWNSTKKKDIVVTINDKTNNKMYNASRYHKTFSTSSCRALYVSKTSGTQYNASNTHDINGTSVAILPVTKFTFAGGDKPTAPTKIESSDVTYNSATISWTAVDGADSYNLYYKTTGSYTKVENATSPYTLSNLDPTTTYYVHVKTVKNSEESDAPSDITFTTLAEPAHEHNNITFTKWESDNSLPTTAGNYYLNKNVIVSGWNTPTGITNLCLNGKTLSLGANTITADATLNIYDCDGNGKITSSKNALFNGTITVSGTVGLYGGTIENTSTGDYAYGIYQNGTFQLGGAVDIVSPKANIYLNSNKVVTIESGFQQPTSPISLYRLSGVLTSGWNDNMSTANPSDYFVSANSQYSIGKNASGELELASAVIISEDSPNPSFTYGTTANVQLTRTFSDAYYNTICLPFALTSEQITSVFGDTAKVQSLTSSDLSDNGMTLTLGFSEVTAMEAGKPYLIKPADGVVNPTFNSVTIAATTPATLVFDNNQVKFVGTFGKTSITAGTKNMLFLAANNELVWAPAGSGELKGMRAYFSITYPGASKIAACRVALGRNAATDISSLDGQQSASDSVQKVMQNGQLVIIKNGKRYSVYGQPIQ